MIRGHIRGWLRRSAVIAGVWALAVYFTGGGSVTIAGLRLASRDGARPAAAALLLLLVHLVIDGRHAGPGTLRDALERMAAWQGFTRLQHALRPSFVALALALIVGTIGLIHGSRSAGGSDSYGYISQAELWFQGLQRMQGQPGALVTPEPAASRLPWPNAIDTLAPLGYRPSPDGTGIVPTYAPGLPLLMAAGKALAGQAGLFWITPLSGALLVMATFGIGRRAGSSAAGVIAAWLVATSPALLFTMVQPLSDVPAAACWALALLLILGDSVFAAAGAGIAAAVALMIRPNLMLVGTAIAVWRLWHDWSRRNGLTRMAGSAAFAACAAPGVLVVALINQRLYGSATSSGYGDLSTLFSFTAVPLNVWRYGSWLVDSESLLVLAGIGAIAWPWRRVWLADRARSAAALLGLTAAAIAASYFVYLPFDLWWYLRFLLPAWPAIFLGMGMLVVSSFRRPSPALAVAAVIAAIWVGARGIAFARDAGTFNVQRDEHRYDAAAQLTRAHTDPGAVVFAMQHSGSVRYYGGRATVRYDQLDAAWLDRSVAWLDQHGAHPYALLDRWEVTRFRDRFGGAGRIGALRMNPIVTLNAPNEPALYDLLAPDDKTFDAHLVASSPIARVPLPNPAPPLAIR